MEGKSYADLLRTVKAKVNPSEIGVELSEVRQTKKGELLLKVQNGPDKAETLKREITEKLPSTVAAKVVTNKVLHMKGLVEVTTLEEVVDVIAREISVSADTFKVRSLRPAFGNKQNPAFGNKQNVTVIMPAAAAGKLIRMQKIKIGWMRCRIEDREEDKKCYRCWEHGHFKAECKGPNRERLCMKCAGEGHKANECQNSPYCIHCKGEGRQSESFKCPTVTKIRGHVLR
ncbi:hypothetical protein QE152_g9623 [Popillia japonica]|uniref:CCHC-type domain-containing protein n=1 Tax=Popillia japonica TaxID=7064 RepID=A0AAW1LY95_POPJA